MFASAVRELIDGEKKTAKRKSEVKEFLGLEDERIKVDIHEAGDSVWGTLETPKKSKFSSGKRLRQSRYSEGVIDIDANRLSNKSTALAE